MFFLLKKKIGLAVGIAKTQAHIPRDRLVISRSNSEQRKRRLREEGARKTKHQKRGGGEIGSSEILDIRDRMTDGYYMGRQRRYLFFSAAVRATGCWGVKTSREAPEEKLDIELCFLSLHTDFLFKKQCVTELCPAARQIARYAGLPFSAGCECDGPRKEGCELCRSRATQLGRNSISASVLID